MVSEIRMTTNVVLGHRRNDIATSALLQGPGFLADHKKRPGDTLFRHDFGKPFWDIINAFGLRRDVILYIEIDHQEHFLILGRIRAGHPQNKNRDDCE